MSLHHMLRAAAGNTAGPSDPYFEYNTLLLTGDGTNGAQNNTFLDSSTNNFTITRNGNTTQGSFSPYGSLWSNYFDGSGDYLLAGGTVNIGSGDYTIEAWVYLNALPTYSMICGYGSQSYIGVRPTSLAFGNSTGATYPEWNFTFSTGTWYHVAIVKQSNTLKAFVNGNQLALSSGSASSSAVFCAGQLYVGRYGGSPTYDLNGYISNFRVVNGTALYTSNFTPSTTPLTAVSGTSLLTCQSNRFIDNSSNNFAITVNGNTSVQRFSPFNATAPYNTNTIGGSGYFDGTGDYLSVPSNTVFAYGTGNFTVECWIYKQTTGTRTIIDSTSNPGTFGFLINDTQIIGYQTNGSAFTFTYALPLNSWQHIAFVRSSGVLYLYVNGISVSSLTCTSNFASSQPLIIGRNAGTGLEQLNGYLVDLRIVKGTAVYTTNFTPPTAPLTAVTNTSLLCNFTNAGIPDAAMMNDLETVGNAQVSTSVKKYGTGSLAFDGTGDYLVMPASPNLQFGSGDFTVELWWYPTTLASTQTIIYHTDVATVSGTGKWVLTYNTSFGMRFYLNAGAAGSVDQGSTSGWSSNNWYHVAVVKSGSTLTIYRNGTSIGSGSNTATVGANVATYIGGEPFDPLYMNGYIDDLRITKGYARYTTNFTPPTAALPTY